ncbi:hypothetical protein E2C01_015662 [Portunus trituberculatus]|uniref:Uncharacterized protein n=1 Tax=Portunus trituberculatus TaxID=210409 RepID=A0A5B7DM57_PORTR|nr:hypothetical protein [Portunus trituberculatus]
MNIINTDQQAAHFALTVITQVRTSNSVRAVPQAASTCPHCRASRRLAKCCLGYSFIHLTGKERLNR